MITQKQLDRVCNEYPFYASINHLVNEFRKILLEKNISKLEEWIDSHFIKNSRNRKFCERASKRYRRCQKCNNI